eukprot:2900597-Lingulodinium_polyedra.AAC.1
MQQWRGERQGHILRNSSRHPSRPQTSCRSRGSGPRRLPGQACSNPQAARVDRLAFGWQNAYR